MARVHSNLVGTMSPLKLPPYFKFRRLRFPQSPNRLFVIVLLDPRCLLMAGFCYHPILRVWPRRFVLAVTPENISCSLFPTLVVATWFRVLRGLQDLLGSIRVFRSGLLVRLFTLLFFK